MTVGGGEEEEGEEVAAACASATALLICCWASMPAGMSSRSAQGESSSLAWGRGGGREMGGGNRGGEG